MKERNQATTSHQPDELIANLPESLKELLIGPKKNQYTTAQLNKLITEIRALPRKPVGDHLSDDEFIGYTLETLDPQHFERVDGHLASCPECTTEMKRLIEASEEWRYQQGSSG